MALQPSAAWSGVFSIMGCMYTTWEHIRRIAREFMRLHGASLVHILKRVVAVLAIAALLEIFVFNFNHWATLGNNCVNMSSKITLPTTTDSSESTSTEFKVTEYDNVIEFSHINREVNNIRIDFDGDQPAQAVDVKIQYTDDAHETYFDSTEYSSGIPTRQVATNDDATEYLKVNTVGTTDNLRIEIGGEDISYPITVKAVYINNVYPLNFRWMRFWCAAVVLGLIYIFRPKSSIYRCIMVERPRKSKFCIILTACIEIYLITVFLFMGSNLVGVATQNYNSGSWNSASVVTSFEVGGENSQQYARLAESMAHGKLYLEEDPPDWLQQMSDPYDKGARDELQKSTGESCLWDTAYYNGHYYVYFGVVPVVLLYLPFYLLTGGGSFPTAIGVWLAAIMFLLGCTALLDRFARYHFKRVSLGLYLLLQIPLVFCSGMLYLIKFPTFYSLPIIMALAFTVWGLYFWMRGRAAEKPGRWFLAGSLCMALVLGCRPQLVVLSAVAIPLFWRHYITKRNLFTPKGAREFACLAAPYVLVFGAIMAYNYARFGSPFDFGSNYNLTTNDMTKRGWDLGRLAPALFAYFFQSPTTTGVFPYLQAATFDTTYMGQTIKEATFGGIFACLPVLWLLPFSKRVIKMRIRSRSTRTIAGVVIVMLVGGVIIALADAEMAGILQRYFADFSFPFLVVAVLLAFIINENVANFARWRTLMSVLICLVGISVVYSVALCFVAEVGWYSEAYPWAYQSILHTFQFWT